MDRKRFYKELLYLFGSHSNYSEQNKKFIQQYELYYLKFDLNNYYSIDYNDFIPFEGKIPDNILNNMSYHLEIKNNIIKTSPLAFISFLISLHDFYTNLYHDGNIKTLKGKEKDIFIYTIDKYTKNNYIYINDVNKLNDIINNFYENNFNKNKDNIDIEINKTIMEIDNHDNLPYYDYIDYKEILFNNTNTFIRDCRISNSNLRSYYFMNTDNLEDILDIFDKIFFKNVKLHGDNIIEINRYLKDKYNNYRLKDFNKGVNNLNIIYDRNLNGYKKLSYNLNTHKLIIELVNNNIHLQKNKIAEYEDKEILLQLLNQINEKITNDLRNNKLNLKTYR